MDMETVIQFTPAQLIALAAAIRTIASAVGVIINLITKIKEPETKQKERISHCEERLNKMDVIIEKFQGYFSNDDRRFREIEEGNKITQTALLALLKHSINGNDTKALKEAEKNLEDYLINR